MTSIKRQSNISFFNTLGLLLAFLLKTSGQLIGSDICSCAPSKYEFKFDFSLFCPPVNITQGDAVTSTSCMVSPFENPSVGDLVPVAVQEIVILELDQNLDVLAREEILDNFKDGDTFSYSSYAAEPGKIVDPLNVPRAIQFNIVGINALEQAITNIVVITFSNSCQVYPVLIPGQYAGWVRFLDLVPPENEYCPVAPDIPTPSPTPFPTLSAGTFSPTSLLSQPPTVFEVIEESSPPTRPPTSIMSMSMNFGMFDSLDSEFGLTMRSRSSFKSRKHSKKCTEESDGSSKGSKKGSGKGKGGSIKGKAGYSKDSKKLGGHGKGGSSSSSITFSSSSSKGGSDEDCTGSSLTSKRSGKGKSGKRTGSSSSSKESKIGGSSSSSKDKSGSKGSKKDGRYGSSNSSKEKISTSSSSKGSGKGGSSTSLKGKSGSDSGRKSGKGRSNSSTKDSSISASKLSKKYSSHFSSPKSANRISKKDSSSSGSSSSKGKGGSSPRSSSSKGKGNSGGSSKSNKKGSSLMAKKEGSSSGSASKKLPNDSRRS